MVIMGSDMSLWWSYHSLNQHEIDKTTIIKAIFQPNPSKTEGDCHPIREIMVNGIRHCN
jgi:hypothetical protein